MSRQARVMCCCHLKSLVLICLLDTGEMKESGPQSHQFPFRAIDLRSGESTYGYVIVTSAFLLMAVMWMAFYSFGIFFKPVLKEFGWTRAVTAGAFSLCSFIQGLLAIAMGALTDRFGPRLVMTLCGFLLAAGYVLMSQLSSLWQLYLFFSIILVPTCIN